MTRMTIAAAMLLAACGGEPDRTSETANVAEPAPETPAPAPAPVPSPTPIAPGAALPPADAEFRYVGRWAVDAGSCAGAAWRWRERRLETPAGTVCDFNQVAPVPGGYDIAATCTAEAPPAADRIKLRFAESARSMLVEAEKALSPVGLVYCGA